MHVTDQWPFDSPHGLLVANPIAQPCSLATGPPMRSATGTAKPYCTMQSNRQINKQFMRALIGHMNYLLIHPVRMHHAARQVDQRPFAEPGDLHVSKINLLIRNPMNSAPQGINGLIKH